MSTTPPPRPPRDPSTIGGPGAGAIDDPGAPTPGEVIPEDELDPELREGPPPPVKPDGSPVDAPQEE